MRGLSILAGIAISQKGWPELLWQMERLFKEVSTHCYSPGALGSGLPASRARTVFCPGFMSPGMSYTLLSQINLWD